MAKTKEQKLLKLQLKASAASTWKEAKKVLKKVAELEYRRST